MKYVFFGSPRFAEIVLNKLLEVDLIPVALVCNPDRPVGRKKVVTPPPTKKLITDDKSQITILQPEKIDTDFLDKLRVLKADFFIVAAYAKILPKELLDIPRLGVIGVHPSLLPKYRGSSPIQSFLLSNEAETGISLYLMDEKMDHGPILKIKRLKIKDQNYLELEKELAELGGETLVETLPLFLRGGIEPEPQDEAEAAYTHKFKTEDAYIDPDDLKIAEFGDTDAVDRISKIVRAFNPEPGAYSVINGKRIKILEVTIENNSLRLRKIQTEGKKPQNL